MGMVRQYRFQDADPLRGAQTKTRQIAGDSFAEKIVIPEDGKRLTVTGYFVSTNSTAGTIYIYLADKNVATPTDDPNYKEVCVFSPERLGQVTAGAVGFNDEGLTDQAVWAVGSGLDVASLTFFKVVYREVY